MDDIQKALDFSNQLEEFLETNSTSQTTSSEDADLLAVAQNLASRDFSYESRLKQSLYARLSARTSNSTRSPQSQRRLVTATLSIAIFMALVFTVPPLRTLAQEVIKRLQTLTLTNAPSYLESHLTATPTPDPANPPVYQIDLPLEHAIAQADFTPLLPIYIPDGYTLKGYRASEGQFATTLQPTNMTHARCCAVLEILQLRATQNRQPLPVGDVPIVDVEVRGVPGLWVEDSHTGITPDAKGDLKIMPTTILTWEADGYLFWMSSYNSQNNQPLSQAEMLKVADELQLPAN